MKFATIIATAAVLFAVSVSAAQAHGRHHHHHMAHHHYHHHMH